MKYQPTENYARQELALYFSDSEQWFGEGLYEALKVQGCGATPLLDWRDRYLSGSEQIARSEIRAVCHLGRLVPTENS
jgi:hypothetical protein